MCTHGYPENLEIWCRVARRLAPRFTVHAFDWPGLGHSAPFLGGATPFHLADQLVAVLDALELDRVSVVGLDMGGQPALVATARHPDRVDRLVVTNSLAMGDAPTSWDIRVMRNQRWNRTMLRLPHVVFGRALVTFLPRFNALSADARRDFWTGFRQRAVRDRIARMCAGYQASLPRLVREYEQIRVPVLALWGSRDSHFPPAQAEALAATLHNARVRIVDGGPHWMAWSHAEAVANEIERFLS